jgi:hypothetical protein
MGIGYKAPQDKELCRNPVRIIGDRHEVIKLRRIKGCTQIHADIGPGYKLRRIKGYANKSRTQSFRIT